MIRRLASIVSVGFGRLDIDQTTKSARLLSRISVMCFIVALLCQLTSSYSRADQLILSVDPSSQTIQAGQSGSLELYLSNPSQNTQIFKISAFQVAIEFPGQNNTSYLQFTQSDIPTTNYIFNTSNIISFANYVFPNTNNNNIVSTSDGSIVPAREVTFGDSAINRSTVPLFNADYTYITINPGQSVALGILNFSSSASTPSGTYDISIIPTTYDATTLSYGNTYFEDNLLNPQNYVYNGSSITVDGIKSVPEPSSFTLALLGISGVLSIKTIRDRKKAIL